MKITINVDCTPQEARLALGLPDVKPMQDKLMQDIEDKMTSNLKAMSPEELMKNWLPGSSTGLDLMQNLFAQMTGGKHK